MAITINNTKIEDWTKEKKIAVVKKRIENMFKNIKNSVEIFNKQLLQTVNENRLKLTAKEITKAFGSEAFELDNLRKDLKAITDRITIK